MIEQKKHAVKGLVHSFQLCVITYLALLTSGAQQQQAAQAAAIAAAVTSSSSLQCSCSCLHFS